MVRRASVGHRALLPVGSTPRLQAGAAGGTAKQTGQEITRLRTPRRRAVGSCGCTAHAGGSSARALQPRGSTFGQRQVMRRPIKAGRRAATSHTASASAGLAATSTVDRSSFTLPNSTSPARGFEKINRPRDGVDGYGPRPADGSTDRGRAGLDADRVRRGAEVGGSPRRTRSGPRA